MKRAFSIFMIVALMVSFSMVTFAFAEGSVATGGMGVLSEPSDVSVTLHPMSFTADETRVIEGDAISQIAPGEIFMVKVTLSNAGSSDLSLGAYGVKIAYDPNAFEPYFYEGEEDNIGPVAFASKSNGGFASTWSGTANTGIPGTAIWNKAGTDYKIVKMNETATLGYLLLRAKTGIEEDEFDFTFIVDGEGEYNKNYVTTSDVNRIQGIDYSVSNKAHLKLVYREDQSPNVTLQVAKFEEGDLGPIEGSVPPAIRRGDILMVKVLLTNDMPETLSIGAYGVKITYDSDAFEPYSYEGEEDTIGPVAFASKNGGGFASTWSGTANTGITGIAIWNKAGSDYKTVASGDTAVLGYLLLKVKDDAAFASYDFGFVVDGRGEENKNYITSSDAQRILGIDYSNTNKTRVDVVSFTSGDVNDSGAIDASDALIALQHAAELRTLTGNAFLAADVNNSGVIDATDALRILQYAAELITEF